MKMTPTFMIAINNLRNLRKIKDLLLVWRGSYNYFLLKNYTFLLKSYTFLETSGKIKLNEDYPNYHDDYGELQEDQGCLPVWGGS